jgi:hypothetical protein
MAGHRVVVAENGGNVPLADDFAALVWRCVVPNYIPKMNDTIHAHVVDDLKNGLECVNIGMGIGNDGVTQILYSPGNHLFF